MSISILYQRNHPGKLTITISETKKGNAEILLDSLISQHVCVYDMRSANYYIYDLTTNGGVTQVKESYPWYDGDYNTFTSYIWNIGGRSNAIIFGNIFPFRPEFNGGKPTVKTITNQGIMSIHVSCTLSDGKCIPWIGVYNSNTTTKFIIGKKFTQELGPQMLKKFKCHLALDGLSIRDTIHPHNMSYNDLGAQERENYIPMEVANGTISQISVSQSYDWVPIEDHIYHGTLRYVATNDKDFHMVDDCGNRYRYGIDQFRHFIPLLANGALNGSFEYTVRGGSRTVKYVLVPTQTDKSDLILCDSDSERDSPSP